MANQSDVLKERERVLEALLIASDNIVDAYILLAFVYPKAWRKMIPEDKLQEFGPEIVSKSSFLTEITRKKKSR